jgi:ABC-type spermidine/putrescine transport system permease subunit I
MAVIGRALAEVKAAAGEPRARRLPARLSAGLLAAPSLLFVVLFFLAPLVLLLVYSFGQMNVLTFQISFGWTFANWTSLANGVYVSSLIRSLLLTVGSTALCAVIGFPVALAISHLRGRVQSVVLVGVIVPYWISFVVRTYAWLNLLAPQGLATRLLELLHLVSPGSDLRYTPFAIVVGMVASYLPLMILPIFVAIDRIDPDVLAASSDLGGGAFATFRRVVLPLSAPGLIAGVLLVGIPATGEYTTPAILGGGKTLMIGNVISDQFLGVGDFPAGAAIASAVMGLMLVLLALSRRRLTQLEDVL